MTTNRKVIIHETKEDCKMEGHHFTASKNMLKELERKANELYDTQEIVLQAGQDWTETERLLDAGVNTSH